MRRARPGAGRRAWANRQPGTVMYDAERRVVGKAALHAADGVVQPVHAGKRSSLRTSVNGGLIMATQRAVDEADIRQRIDKLVQAIRALDLEGVKPIYAPDIVSFDIVPP